MSKGSNRRPTLVPQEDYAESWERIFNRDKPWKETKKDYSYRDAQEDLDAPREAAASYQKHS